MENGILKGWIMLIKRYIIFLLFVLAGAVSAQMKRMSNDEFKYYEYLIRSGQLERYRKPSMKENLWKDLMNDIITQIVEAKVPTSIKEWKKKGSSHVPSSSKIRLLAHRLRVLVENPELPEVSKQKLEWFKNIGNGFIVLENEQSKMIRAVMRNNEKEYLELYYQYMQNIKKLSSLLNNRDNWKLSRKDLAAIQKKNIAERKKKADYEKRRYEYTRQLLKNEEQQERKMNRTNQQNKPVGNTQTKNTRSNNRRGARR